jgi:rhodanese-related sulfurtransferase
MAAQKIETRNILLESLLVVIAGFVFAVLANALSQRGLSLTRDYFPARNSSAGALLISATNQDANRATPATPSVTPTERLNQAGLQTIDDNMATNLIADPRYGAGLIIFVDARDKDHYLAGHIPGAYEYDRYHPEMYLAEVLPACQAAEQIVVYCNGGDCEDSEFAALALKDAGIANRKLFVYVNGIKGWIAHESMIEIGSRRSGNLRKNLQ